MFRGLILLCAISLLLTWGCMGQRQERKPSINRGKYLVTIAGCHDCHAPKVPGPNGAPLPDASSVTVGSSGKATVSLVVA